MCKEFLLEAESFNEKGGWVVDQQSMETIHSSYLMAHGMGIPVEDAKTDFEIESEGEYHMWALTRDWTYVWDKKASAGKFNIEINGELSGEVFGTNGEKWDWQYGGTFNLKKGKNTIKLKDLTGFNGRCDAIYFSQENKRPSNELEKLDELRKRLNWHEVSENEHIYDLIVVGGGVAGICLALSAIRSGCDTLLIHDRGILGGCNSSEIRVCMGGIANLAPYNNIGNVVKEIAPVMGDPSIFKKEYYEDDRKLFAFEASHARDRVIFNEFAGEVTVCDGSISSVITTNTLNGKKTKYSAKLFADCTGDGVLSRLAGAQTMYGREARSEFNETLAPSEHEKLVMGHSIRWYSENEGEESSFPDIDFGLKFNDSNCLDVFNGDWEQETGFRRDMIGEIEYIRDYGLRAIYSNWSYQKNNFKDKQKYANYRLKWVSPIGGKRESFRVVGDYILTQNDIEQRIKHEDATSYMTWSIDLHFPEFDNEKEFGEPFRSFAYHRGITYPYPVPYRCLYSKDINNLFLGGRIVSTSHVAFSSIRVMRTLGQLGEVVGMAAGICKQQECLPREVYSKHLDLLKEAMTKGIKIPSAFCCGCGSEESYHYKDIGWLQLNPYHCREQHIEKFKRGIKALGIQHKYPLPDILKD